MAEGAFQGVKVIEFGHFLLVPMATAILADLGADVIKVENPKGGEPARFPIPVENVAPPADFPYLWFHEFNRGKRDIALDVNKERGREVLYKLVETADVFATNFDPRFVERVKADYDTLSKINPRLIYCQCTGYGTLGPDRDKPGFDYAAFWARSGIMDRVSEPGAAPRPQRPGLGDNLCSVAIAGAIGSALFVRERTGVGQKVELNLYQFGVWGIMFDIIAALHIGEQIRQTDRRNVSNAMWNTYQTKDGRWVIFVMPQSDRWWPQFCQAMSRPEWEKDPKFDTHMKRMEQNLTLIPMVEEIMASKTSAEWDEIIKQYDLVGATIQTPLEVAKDPQAWENNFFAEIEHPSGVKVKLLQTPIKFSKTPASIRSVAPELGQHTEEILLESDYTWDDIAELKSQGIIL